tara:strand:- start:1220 stop:2464 length:1245 start_codon:yes stop_codon:yes gene_type:complete
MIKIVFQLLSIISILVSSLFSEETSEEIQRQIDREKKKAEALKTEIVNLTQQIKNKDLKGQTTIEKLADIGEKIELAEKLIKTLKKDEKRLDNLISETRINISEKESELDVIKEKSIRMITHLYKNKNNNYLDVLIGSETWSDLIYKIKYLEILSSEQKKINNDMESTIKELNDDILMFTNDIINKKNLKLNQKNSLVELISNKEKNKQEFQNIQSEKFNLEKTTSDKKSILLQIDKMIQELYVDKESAKKREKEIERIRKEKKEKPLDIEYFSKRKGELPWPVSGSIVSKFGEVESGGVKTTNIGIEIKTKKNAEVKTIYDGIIIEIGFNPYYGSFIWIDHGNGFSTIYANLDENNIFVEKEEYIESEGLIGKVNNVENNSHGILNFMIWGNKGKDKNGDYILINENPEEWIK